MHQPHCVLFFTNIIFLDATLVLMTVYHNRGNLRLYSLDKISVALGNLGLFPVTILVIFSLNPCRSRVSNTHSNGTAYSNPYFTRMRKYYWKRGRNIYHVILGWGEVGWYTWAKSPDFPRTLLRFRLINLLKNDGQQISLTSRT